MKQFEKVEVRKPRTNVFDLSHEKKLSCGIGELIPIYLQEVIPGDMFKVNTELLIRLAPLVFPLQHRVNAYVHYFFVPNRLLWKNWENFITGGKDGDDISVHPYVMYNDTRKSYYERGSLADYLGIPTTDGVNISAGQAIKLNALPFKAYNQIYNDFYRDPNLEDEINIYEGVDGEATGFYSSGMVLRTRCWEKDYFTSALPWAQRGDAVEMPIEGHLHPVYSPTSTAKQFDGTPSLDGAISISGQNLRDSQPSNIRILNLADPQTVDFEGIEINDLRTALRLQEWLEKNARGGWRYVEQMLSHFGVVSKDARLQRAEYLGGGKQPIVISEVLATADTGSYDVGQYAGHGISVGKSNGFKKYFTEHGWIIGILSVVPRSAYYQGVPRKFRKVDKFDYYWPEFAHLGEQEVLQEEIYFDPAGSDVGHTFGYQERYSEYKWELDTVHGDYRTTGYENYHMGRKFSSAPALNSTFVHIDKAGTDRVFQVTTQSVDKLYVQLYNRVKAIRPIPYFSTPRL